jgi:uncharacterized protein (DUF1697 family)
MSSYIAMLRGINVSGQKLIRMEALRASFAALGFKNVRTYVQSGNVVFDAAKGSPAGLTKKIADRIKSDFGFDVPVFVLSAKELADTVSGNPLPRQKGIDVARLHVTFLSGTPPANAAELIEPLLTKPEQFHVSSRAVYLYCPNGYGTSKLSNTSIEKKLSAGATTRNWRTVNALLAMVQE